MWIYLIKVTVIWALLLLCFELLYKKSPYYKVNRLYLILTLILGVVLPALPLNLPGSDSPGSVVRTLSRFSNGLQQLDTQPVRPGAQPAPFNYVLLFRWMYYTGALVMLILSIYDIMLILRKAIYGSYQVHTGHRIFNTGKAHAPFSFFGWIFIGRPEAFTDAELGFILAHEDAHNHNRHWLDILIMQCFITVFWFHPLVWRIRHLLKLEQEYEADHLAAGTDAYGYGHFLLRQTLMRAPHPIAHSFHYSPIKLRIEMLTQSRNKRPWKYVALLPVLFGCTLLMARTLEDNQRNRIGDTTAYGGNVFEWQKASTDSIRLEDPVSGKQHTVLQVTQPQIIRMNGTKVYHEDSFKYEVSVIAAQFRNNGQSIHEYLKEKLLEQVHTVPDSLDRIDLTNMVVDARGKIVYYDLVVAYRSPDSRAFSFNGGYVVNDPKYTAIIDKIVKESSDWLPGMVAGKAVPVFFPNGGSLIFMQEPASFKAVKLERVKK